MEIKGLVCVNMDNKNYCDVTELAPNWENVLTHYMETHYVDNFKYEVHNRYYIAIDYVDDIIDMFNSINITIFSIDYIVNRVMIEFLDEKSRDLVFSVLKGEVA